MSTVATQNTVSSSKNTAASSNGSSAGSQEKVILGQEHSPEQVVAFLKQGRVQRDTALEHLCSTRYELSKLGCLLQVLKPEEYAEVMQKQATLLAAASGKAKAEKGPGQKTTCPVTLAQYLEHAEALEVNIGGVPMVAEVKEFSTGSFGWYLSGKTTVKVDGKALTVQVGLNLTVVGSKEAARE